MYYRAVKWPPAMAVCQTPARPLVMAYGSTRAILTEGPLCVCQGLQAIGRLVTEYVDHPMYVCKHECRPLLVTGVASHLRSTFVHAPFFFPIHILLPSRHPRLIFPEGNDGSRCFGGSRDGGGYSCGAELES